MILKRRGDHDLSPSQRLEELSAELLALAEEVSQATQQLRREEGDDDPRP